MSRSIHPAHIGTFTITELVVVIDLRNVTAAAAADACR